MKTQISDIFILPAFLVPSMYYLVCFLIRGVKKKSSPINCQLTDAVCSHDKVPNWPSIVFSNFFCVFNFPFISLFLYFQAVV